MVSYVTPDGRSPPSLRFERASPPKHDLRTACALLREVAEQGLIYWEPNTERGSRAKTDMLGRINTFLSEIHE